MSYDLALSIAQSAHAGQVDKLGEPYIEHPLEVSRILTQIPTYLACTPHQQNVLQQAALLHDVIEDTPVDGNDLLCAGISDEVIAVVEVLTHGEDESRDDYITRVVAHPLARIVKLADITHNTSPARMSQLHRRIQRKLRMKYARDLSRVLAGHDDDFDWLDCLRARELDDS